MNLGIGVSVALALAATASVGIIAATAERPPIEGVQRGYRGTGMEQVYNPRTLAALGAANKVPISLPSLGTAGPRAGAVYKNVQVLGDISVGQFTRLMVSITNWVSPTQGCAYCHNTANMADDSLYTKVVSRRMLQMTQHLNIDWRSHVAQTGVTCYTCHRGQPVPANIWFNGNGSDPASGVTQAALGKNHPSTPAGIASLPTDPYTPFLEQANEIRVVSQTALPTGDRQSIKQTDWTYALMIHMSNSLGVNCAYCHNTRSFTDWSQSSPQRVTAWYGIRMVRDLNNTYLNPLRVNYPANRLGAQGDAPKVNCTTCHIGVYKPLFGVSMAKDFPELGGGPRP